MNIGGIEVDLLARALDVSVKRHEVAATNLANIDTPQYRAKELRFEAAFRNAIKRDPKEALDLEPEIIDDESATEKSDGNTVSLEKEVGVMNKNALAFQVLGSAMRHKLSLMKQAITGAPR